MVFSDFAQEVVNVPADIGTGRLDTGNDLDKDDLVLLTKDDKRASKGGEGTRTEIVGDGEEVEVEVDAEELSDNQLDLIYRK